MALFGEKQTLKQFARFGNTVVTIGLIVTTSILAVALTYCWNSKNTVMQPPFVLTEPTEIDYKNNKTLQKKTFEVLINSFLAYTENLTPANAKTQTKKVLAYVSKNFYSKYESRLDDRARRIQANGLVRSFYETSRDISTYGTILLKGERTLTKGETVINKVNATIKIEYQLDNANGFVINNVFEGEK